MKKDAAIFVAGGTGMVGSAFIRVLLREGFVNITSSFHDRRPSEQEGSEETEKSNVRYYKLDLTNQLQTAHFLALEKPEYVFLAAARVGGIEANNTLRGQFIYDNLQIQNNVIHYSYLTGVKKLLFLGSSCIYPKICPQPIREEYLLTSSLEYTNEPYAIAKIAGMKLCESYNLQYGTNFLSVMPTNLYGIKDNFNLFTGHVLPALMRKFYLANLLRTGQRDAIAKDIQRHPLGFPMEDSLEATLKKAGITKEGVVIWGSGSPRRDFLFVDDVAEACLYIMEHVDFHDLTVGMKEIRNTHINIGSGYDISIREMAETVRDIIGFQGEILYDPSKPEGMTLKMLDNSKIYALGWRPKTDLREGIKRVYHWYSAA